MAARNRQLNLAALAGALVALAGCAAPVGRAPSGEPRPPSAGDTIEPRELGAAAGALLTQSRNERRAGDLARAAATLERALRVEPGAPEVWLELARVRLEQGDYAQAEQLGLKAESLADPRSTLARESRALQTEARYRQARD